LGCAGFVREEVKEAFSDHFLFLIAFGQVLRVIFVEFAEEEGRNVDDVVETVSGAQMGFI
jgi:hypothetical protein